MKDWFTVQPDVVKLMNKHFTRGRGGRKIRYITRHHLAGIGTTEQVWGWWQTRAASAHYVVENSGRIGQLVWDRDTAWSNANAVSNAESITIEHSNSAGSAADWPINDTVIREGAKLAAALCWFYKLGRPEFGKNIRDHRDFHPTSCPHHLARGGRYHDQWMRTAQEHYDWMVANDPKNPKPKAPAPSPSSSSSSSPFGGPMTLIRSLINSAKSFTANGMLALIDRATWETRVVVNELARKQGIDPDALVDEAIRKDNEK